MVNEREPPRLIASSPQKRAGNPLMDITHGTNEPSFGKASPMRNPLKSDRSSGASQHGGDRPRQHAPSDIFNRPKPHQPRPEHHRPARPSYPNIPSTGSFQQGSYNSLYPTYSQPGPVSTTSPGFVEIPRPKNFVPPVQRAPQPAFSTSTQGYQSVNAWKGPSQPIDLTSREGDDGFNPDKALGIDRYGGFDPTNYVDSAQANENIKALLEGAFDDEDDKPKTRLRKKRKEEGATAALSDKMDSLKVDDKQKEEEPEVEDEDDGTVDGLNVKLLPHQIDGVAWMLDKEVGTRKKNGVLPKGGILADDMGLGKTIQALSLILTNRRPSADDLAENPKLKVPTAAGKGTLIVAPLALIKQWEGEIKTKVDVFPKLKVLVHHGPSRTKRFDDLKKYDIVITTYQTLTSEHSDSSDNLKVGCFGLHWYRIILDEAHSIKNRNAKMTKAAYDLTGVYRWCLTGTPMQNNLDELQSLIRFLKIKPYCEMSNWKDQIAQPMRNGRGGLAMKRLQFFLRAFMKRRTKEVLKKDGALNFGKNNANAGDCQSEGFKIVARNVQTVVAKFNEAEREFYQKLETRTEKNLAAMMGGAKTDYIGALVLLLRLRQTCNHPELIRGNLRKEKEAMPSGSQQSIGPATPRKPKASAGEEVDDIADMLGGLTVETKKCDSCGSKLNENEMSAGVIRCSECDEDMRRLGLQSHHSKRHSKKSKRPKAEAVTSQPKRKMHTRLIVDNDAEDDEGEWLVSKDKQRSHNLGKAGGADDEDAEGGGQWLGNNDSESEGEEDSTTAMGKYSESEGESEEDGSDVDSDESSSASENTKDVDQRHIPSTKIRKLLELLESESDDNKFIIFSEFTSMLDIVEPFLCGAGFRYTRYDGSMKNDDREASLKRLRDDSKTRILLCSLRCGSLGLNLTAASRVVIMEPFWNPFVEEQAIDRVHRLNQTKDVVVYRLTIANSVEERILELQQKKRELANAAIEGGKAVGKLSMQDILKLFKRDAEHDASHEDPKTLALGSGRPAGVLKSSSQTNVSQVQPPSVQVAPKPKGTAQLPQHMPPSQVRSSSKPSGDSTPKFTIPKSLQGGYQAYKQRDVWNERR